MGCMDQLDDAWAGAWPMDGEVFCGLNKLCIHPLKLDGHISMVISFLFGTEMHQVGLQGGSKAQFTIHLLVSLYFGLSLSHFLLFPMVRWRRICALEQFGKYHMAISHRSLVQGSNAGSLGMQGDTGGGGSTFLFFWFWLILPAGLQSSEGQ